MDAETPPCADKPSMIWQIPIVFIGTVILWLSVTWLRSSLVQKRQKRYAEENKQLQELIRFDDISEKTKAEAFKAFHERAEAERKAKFDKSRGRTLIETEIEERRKIFEEYFDTLNAKKSTGKFEDAFSWEELMAQGKKNMEKEEMRKKDEAKNKEDALEKSDQIKKGKGTEKLE